MSLFSLKLLGPVQLQWPASAYTPLPLTQSQRPSGLSGGRTAADRPRTLAALFWTDVAEAQALGELRRCLHNLSSLLPGCIHANRQMVYFAGSADVEVDLEVFQRLQAQGDVVSLAEAATIYRGEFMESLGLAGCPEFEMWLLSEREHWRGKVLRLLQQLVTHHAERGE